MGEQPKRILIIGLTERMGGVETFIYNTTTHSDKTKYKYDYLVHGTDHCVFENEINTFYNDGEQHIFFCEKYKSNPFACIRHLKKFYAKNGNKYDYIHFQSGSTAEILYVYPFCKKYGIKVISHSHNGNGYSPILNRLFRGLVNRVTSERLSCSAEATQWLFGMKYLNRTQLIVNGVDTNRFTYNEKMRKEIRNQYGLTTELIIGHIGRFSEQKNHIFMLEIFKSLLKRDPTAKLLLVGVGELQNKIQKLSSSLQIDKSIIFAGKQIRTEDYYSAFDIFLMPSLYEGLPIVGVEAQCEGLECLFSDQIDKQILITDRAKMLSLNDSPEVWVDAILSSQNTNRLKYPAEILKSGYSLTDTIKALEKIYEVNNP